MQIDIHNFADGKKAKSIELADTAFANDYNESLVHQVVVAFMAGARAGTKAQKTRSEVSGGGAKPFKQKGTGRARAGTTRGPLWRHGGVTFAAKPRSFDQKVNKKMYRRALQAIFSELVRSERLMIVDEIKVDEVKTKTFVNKLAGLGLKSVLIIAEEADRNLYLSARNIPHVEITDVAGINPVNLLAYETVVVTADSAKKIEEWLA